MMSKVATVAAFAQVALASKLAVEPSAVQNQANASGANDNTGEMRDQDSFGRNLLEPACSKVDCGAYECPTGFELRKSFTKNQMLNVLNVGGKTDAMKDDLKEALASPMNEKYADVPENCCGMCWAKDVTKSGTEDGAALGGYFQDGVTVDRHEPYTGEYGATCMVTSDLVKDSGKADKHCSGNGIGTDAVCGANALCRDDEQLTCDGNQCCPTCERITDPQEMAARKQQLAQEAEELARQQAIAR